MTIPAGIRPESDGAPNGNEQDSALNTASQPASNPHYQRDHGTGPHGDKTTTAAVREIPPLDALTAAVCLIRPDWNHAIVRATLARTHGSWLELATRALRVATDPDARTPLGIENADMRKHDTTPIPPPWHQVKAAIDALDAPAEETP